MIGRLMLLPQKPSLQNLLMPYPPKAGHLIVTIYGDIVEPRGSSLWVGDLITLCGQFGVNESLVRTAVSRLVNRDQLQGEREGRRSYYGLTPAARTAFHVAADQIFSGPDSDCGLMLVVQNDRSKHEELMAQGFGAGGDNLFIGADRPDRTASGAKFRAFPDQQSRDEILAVLDRAFDLTHLAKAYQGFIDRFGKLDETGIASLEGLDALTVRLGMVHAFRAIRLEDPRLPPSVLPDNWPGVAARTIFSEAYVQLSEVADPYIGQNLNGREALLPERPSAVDARLKPLRQKE